MEEGTLEREARALLENNTVRVERAGHTYIFATPTGDDGVNTYRIPKFQWTGWDSQFHTIVFSRLGMHERAEQELASIFAHQRSDGFIPHVAFWSTPGKLPTWAHLESAGRFNRLPWLRPTHTAHIQPPVLAESLSRIAEERPSVLDRFLKPTARYYRWLAENRDPDGDGLISVIAQAETGLDYSPAHDSVIGFSAGQGPGVLNRKSRRVRLRNKWRWNYNLDRIFQKSDTHVEDVLVNSIYIRSLTILGDLAESVGEADIASWAREIVSRATISLLKKSYDKNSGLFWNLAGRAERPVRTKTIISLMPLIIPGLPRDIAMRLVDELTKPDSFWLAYPVPSTPKDSAAFLPDSKLGGELRIWRGSISMNTNWYLVAGLRQHGFDDIAESIAQKSRILVEKHGFNEFYNPLDGSPCGADQFGWATLVIDM